MTLALVLTAGTAGAEGPDEPYAWPAITLGTGPATRPAASAPPAGEPTEHAPAEWFGVNTKTRIRPAQDADTIGAQLAIDLVRFVAPKTATEAWTASVAYEIARPPENEGADPLADVEQRLLADVRLVARTDGLVFWAEVDPKRTSVCRALRGVLLHEQVLVHVALRFEDGMAHDEQRARTWQAALAGAARDAAAWWLQATAKPDVPAAKEQPRSEAPPTPAAPEPKQAPGPEEPGTRVPSPRTPPEAKAQPQEPPPARPAPAAPQRPPTPARSPAHAAYELARRHQEQGRTQAALSAYTLALRQDPRFVEAYLGRAEVLGNRLRQWKRALSDVERAIQLEPKRAQAHLYRGIIYLGMGRFDDAIRALDHTLALDPRNGRAFLARGVCRARKGDAVRAIADYSTAIALDAKFTEAYFNRGLRYAGLGRHRDAVRDFSTTLRLEPKHRRAHYERALSLIRLRDLRAALADLRIANQRDPRDADVLYEVAHVQALAGRLPAARAALDDAIRLRPRDPKLYKARAHVLERLGRRRDAARDRERAHRLEQR